MGYYAGRLIQSSESFQNRHVEASLEDAGVISDVCQRASVFQLSLYSTVRLNEFCISCSMYKLFADWLLVIFLSFSMFMHHK